MYSTIALAVAIIALLVAFSNNPNIPPFPDWIMKLIYLTLTVLLVGAFFSLGRSSFMVMREHNRNLSKLILLETHRSKYKSLPDSLTFDVIVNRAPRQLEGLLQTAEITK